MTRSPYNLRSRAGSISVKNTDEQEDGLPAGLAYQFATLATVSPVERTESQAASSSSSSVAASAPKIPPNLPRHPSTRLASVSRAISSSASASLAASSSSSTSSDSKLLARRKGKPAIYSLLPSSAMPAILEGTIYLVLFGRTIQPTGLGQTEAGHLGLLIDGRFADFETVGQPKESLASWDERYAENYSVAWYFKTPITPNNVNWAQIEKLSDSYCKYNKGAPGKHSKWPKHCRSFVAAVLLIVLKINPEHLRYLPGLGKEVLDEDKIAELQGHVYTLLKDEPGVSARALLSKIPDSVKKGPL